MELQPIVLYILVFICSLGVSLFTVPQIIFIAARKGLFDLPDERKQHGTRTISNLGGIGIFFAYMVTASLFMPPMFDKWNFVVATSLLFFLTGMMDDLVALRAMKKLAAQLIPALIMVFMADIRIRSLQGIFGIHELPYLISIGLTTSLYLFFTNAFNLIDGINCLAGSMGILYTVSFGILLALSGRIGAACIGFALAGATLGFLRYNVTPAKIFMGDTGSLLLGFTITVLGIFFIDKYSTDMPVVQLVHTGGASFVVSVGILSVTLFDCFRVFFSRMRKGNPPFKADRTHMHHYMLDMGMSHLKAVTILVSVNIFMIVLSLFLQDLDPALAITIMFLTCCLLFLVLRTARKRYVDAHSVSI